MRSDFSNQNNKPKSRAGWNRARVIRAIFFIAIGLAIGFWIHNKNKTDAPPAPEVAKISSAPEQVIEEVVLPVREVS